MYRECAEMDRRRWFSEACTANIEFETVTGPRKTKNRGHHNSKAAGYDCDEPLLKRGYSEQAHLIRLRGLTSVSEETSSGSPGKTIVMTDCTMQAAVMNNEAQKIITNRRFSRGADLRLRRTRIGMYTRRASAIIPATKKGKPIMEFSRQLLLTNDTVDGNIFYNYAARRFTSSLPRCISLTKSNDKRSISHHCHE